MASAMRKIGAYLGLVDEPLYAERSYEEPHLQAVPEHGLPQRSVAVRSPEPEAEIDLRTPTAVDVSTIHTVHPRNYNDARRVGEEFRAGHPVIINLTDMGDPDAKRIVDFAAGLVFGLHGTIERITTKVFLLSPANVDVRDAPAVQQARDGFFNQS